MSNFPPMLVLVLVLVLGYCNSFVTKFRQLNPQSLVHRLCAVPPTLPELYDPVAIDRYFNANPTLAFQRSIVIGSRFASWGLECVGELLVPPLYKEREGTRFEEKLEDFPSMDHVDITNAEWPPTLLDVILGYNYMAVDGYGNEGKVESSDKHSLLSRCASKLRRTLISLGPFFVKIGQILSSRPDLLPKEVIKELEPTVNAVEPFPTSIAIEIIERDIGVDFASLFEESTIPVAAASLGQVYKINYKGKALAVKVKRPDARLLLATDFYLAAKASALLDNLSVFRTNITSALNEFASRIYEELNYERECDNLSEFYDLYGADGTVIVPKLYPDLCSSRLISMSWINGEKLVDDISSNNNYRNSEDITGMDSEMVKKESLELVKSGIKSTLSQLLEKGVLHADPHAGNILKVKTLNGHKLAYIDFGLVAKVPLQVREALVCSVIHLIERNFTALANEFDSLMLMPKEEIERDFSAFVFELQKVCDEILVYPDQGYSGRIANTEEEGTRLPYVKFDAVISALLSIAVKFKFEVPPYFLNNARAIASLEGMALSVDPKFNLLQVLYPFVVTRLLLDPSPKIREALENLIMTEKGYCKLIKWRRLRRLFVDACDLGISKRQLVFGFLRSKFALSLILGDWVGRMRTKTMQQKKRWIETSTMLTSWLRSKLKVTRIKKLSERYNTFISRRIN